MTKKPGKRVARQPSECTETVTPRTSRATETTRAGQGENRSGSTRARISCRLMRVRSSSVGSPSLPLAAGDGTKGEASELALERAVVADAGVRAHRKDLPEE